jgi:hypothetical protein
MDHRFFSKKQNKNKTKFTDLFFFGGLCNLMAIDARHFYDYGC